MSVWADLDDVRARLTRATIDATSSPTQAEVQQWLNEGEAQIRGTLRAAKLPTTYTDQDSLDMLISWTSDYAVGQWLKAVGRASQTADLDEGEAMLERFDEQLQKLRGNAIQLGAELDPSGSVDDGAQRVRYHGDVVTVPDPTITSDEVW